MSFYSKAGRIALLLTTLFSLTSSLSVPAIAQQKNAEDSAAKFDIDTMQAIEDSWSQALLKRDQFALEDVLAPGYVDISANGEVATRNQQIARLLTKDDDPSMPISFEQRVASVRMFGDIALVNGTYVLRYKRDGLIIDDKGIFSHVFQRARSRWQCINSQRTFVIEQAAASRKPGILPFHIPGTGAPAPTPNPPPTQAAPQKEPPASTQPR